VGYRDWRTGRLGRRGIAVCPRLSERWAGVERGREGHVFLGSARLDSTRLDLARVGLEGTETATGLWDVFKFWFCAT
jgi:hypothetical protein